jgi:AhpD family alkylhydroperoxidase
MGERLEAFARFREEMNDKILGAGNKNINRFFALDSRAYDDGALDRRTKEIAGLTASLVLRCDDCITYHVVQCHDLGMNREELLEALNVGLIVGGSIVIPHMRRAVAVIEELDAESAADKEERQT